MVVFIRENVMKMDWRVFKLVMINNCALVTRYETKKILNDSMVNEINDGLCVC